MFNYEHRIWGQVLTKHYAIHRSHDYGASFSSILEILDPNNQQPSIWNDFFVSPINKNMVWCYSIVIYINDLSALWSRLSFITPLIPFSMSPWMKGPHGILEVLHQTLTLALFSGTLSMTTWLWPTTQSINGYGGTVRQSSSLGSPFIYIALCHSKSRNQLDQNRWQRELPSRLPVVRLSILVKRARG